ncbi:2-oxoglutarate and iron-dependent oxygenase domain-containing protein 3-like [Cyprinus carpio]|uniref:2-oxoglutarate and iron-dependent oxygenase domain-containing protein 3-like n=1 Tax=Cyprinus carpio TaxID=7962 RepID=A0A9Q9WXG8_CYPCA|nr:2-oxoglutarate and iron-dependent oxygenase domain-containing protein 3-like [Cyprinus carpio]
MTEEALDLFWAEKVALQDLVTSSCTSGKNGTGDGGAFHGSPTLLAARASIAVSSGSDSGNAALPEGGNAAESSSPEPSSSPDAVIDIRSSAGGPDEVLGPTLSAHQHSHHGTPEARQCSPALRVDASPHWLSLVFIQTRDSREGIAFLPNIDCFLFECVFIPFCCVQASILDLHSGALSMGKQFVNIYRYFKNEIRDVFTEEDFELYRDVRSRIQKAITETFGLDTKRMYLIKPTFFSRINSTSAKTTHDEYWHPHIDKETYGSFDYTSLLYLSDYGLEFGGGRFVFMDPSSNRTVEPRAGRLSFFSSGSENLHHVEKVTWGTRYAITLSFTCDPHYAIDNLFLL